MSNDLDLVLNIEPITESTLGAMDRHELLRETDGTSAIDPLRRELNRVLLGPPSPKAAVRALEAKVRPPTARTEEPYVRLLIGASPGYFRPDDPEAAGTWDPDRLAAFEARVMKWLRRKFGADLVHVSLHLDETTPHVHALVVPTYEKKARKPGRQKRGESAEEFEARKLAAEEAATVRTISRSKNEVFAPINSYELLRRDLHAAVADLGLSYGDDLAGTARNKKTAQWVKEKAAELVEREGTVAATEAKIAEDRLELEREKNEAREVLDRDRAQLDQDRAELDQERAEMAEERVQLDGKWYELGEEQAALADERRELRRERKALDALFVRVRDLMGRVAAYLRRPDLPTEARRDGRDLVQELEDLDSPNP